jgi:hypothetical protein
MALDFKCGHQVVQGRDSDLSKRSPKQNRRELESHAGQRAGGMILDRIVMGAHCVGSGFLSPISADFGKMSKQLLCLDTFSIHPCAVVTFHEPLPQMIERLAEPLQEPIDCS